LDRVIPFGFPEKSDMAEHSARITHLGTGKSRLFTPAFPMMPEDSGSFTLLGTGKSRLFTHAFPMMPEDSGRFTLLGTGKSRFYTHAFPMMPEDSEEITGACFLLAGGSANVSPQHTCAYP